jgi:hypothetical protein
LDAFVGQAETAAMGRRPMGIPPRWVVDLATIPSRANPYWHGRRCLIRCLVAYYLLIRAREPAVLHFGCRLDQAGMRGHCWLTSSRDEELPELRLTAATQEILARAYVGDEAFEWQTSYSQTSATGHASSASPVKRLSERTEAARLF